MFENDDWQSATRASWDPHMQANLRAPFLLSQAFARALPRIHEGRHRQHRRPARAQADAAIHLLQPVQGRAPLAHHHAGPGAGPAHPRQRGGAGPDHPQRAPESEADFDRQREATILGRGAEPQDVCGAVRYLLDAPAVTGQIIAVDGGQHLIWQTPDVQREGMT